LDQGDADLHNITLTELQEANDHDAQAHYENHMDYVDVDR
jgi:hypothetical protein